MWTTLQEQRCGPPFQVPCFFVRAAHEHLFFRVEGHEGTFRVPVALESAGESERAAERRFAWYMQQQGVRARHRKTKTRSTHSY